jgi:hypothetical protein
MFHIATSSNQVIGSDSLTLQGSLIDFLGFRVPDLKQEVYSMRVVRFDLLCKLDEDGAVFHLLVEVAGGLKSVQLYKTIVERSTYCID